MWARIARGSSFAATATVFAYSASAAVALTEPASNASPSASAKRVAAAFVQEDGRKALNTLKNAYPSGASKLEREIENPRLVLAYAPIGDAALARVASQLSRPVDFRVLSLVADEHLQVAVVEVAKHTATDDGGLPNSVVLPNTTLYIAIRANQGENERYTEFYGHQLLERVREATGGDVTSKWSGVLPAKLGYEKTRAEVVEISPVDRSQFLVHAMVCISDQWENDKCGEPQCGFCRFMKLGPCGKEFEVWEACVAEHRDGDKGDFVEKCGEQTWAMKECVDKFPEYYMTVVEDDDDEEQQPSAKAEEEPQFVEVNLKPKE